ncbi:uncharacterized protein BDZ99DRAFT_464826 [Mytilinidion resinicola]|uniref:polynucleotide adenylyltransferase n=1 Tax=Mytilinidion resinicola TaxID=574789 RepID=A0A6A6YH59_9PEZI|nr:uncharacterized protein BDZ99DRAFT_464826 [Mytilinidion resinicola]KAF2807929.1 hypothetical protein BDZ99DRAFT_464826 [Mytilinidion resinicola]
MHTARYTAVCTAKNAFKPSIVLWQQFVAAGTPIQRFSSTIATHDSERPLPQLPSNETAEAPSSPVISDISDQSPAELPLKKHAYPRESIAAANERQIDDIDPHDLSATLEAHRASNRASLIRGVKSNQIDTDYKQAQVKSSLRLISGAATGRGKKGHQRRMPDIPIIPLAGILQRPNPSLNRGKKLWATPIPLEGILYKKKQTRAKYQVTFNPREEVRRVQRPEPKKPKETKKTNSISDVEIKRRLPIPLKGIMLRSIHPTNKRPATTIPLSGISFKIIQKRAKDQVTVHPFQEVPRVQPEEVQRLQPEEVHRVQRPGPKKPKKPVTDSQHNRNTDVVPPIDPMLRQDGSKANLKELRKKSKKESAPMKWPTITTFKQGQQLLEYKGENVEPLSEVLVPESELPWVVKEDLQSMTGAERLSEEISRFNSYMMPTPNERTARQAVIKELSDLVKKHFPKHTVSVFGSEWNGLALATSDIDFRLSVPALVGSKLENAPRYIVRKVLTKDLERLHLIMQRSVGIYMLCSIRHARYPLISVQHIKSRLDLQVVGSNDTSVSRTYVLKYLAEHPGLKELIAVLKVLFDIRGISDVFRGGLGSYSVFMMAVASIKLGPQGTSTDLGQRLLNFLSFWAKFDTYTTGVSIEPAEVFPKTSRTIITVKQKKNLDEKGLLREKLGQIDPAQPYLLCLQDPADATNDVGKKGFAIKHIQATFAHLEKELRTAMKENTRPSLLGPVVGPAYILNKERRATMEEYGASIGPLPEQAAEEAERAPPAEMTIEEFREEYPLPNNPLMHLSLGEVEGIEKEAPAATEQSAEEPQDVVEQEAESASEVIEKEAPDASEQVAEETPDVVEPTAESASEVVEKS